MSGLNARRDGMGDLAEPDAAPGGPMPSEASELRMSVVGQHTLLVHGGTGERRLLDGGWSLMQDAGGNGILVLAPGVGAQPSRSPMWVAHILEFKVVPQPRSGGQGLALIRNGDFFGWVDDLQRSPRQARVFDSCASAFTSGTPRRRVVQWCGGTPPMS